MRRSAWLFGLRHRQLLNIEVVSSVTVLLCALAPIVTAAEDRQLNDQSRGRSIPLRIEYPSGADRCSPRDPWPVTVVSAGYLVPHTEYRFLAQTLNKLGYLVVAIGHEVSGDQPLAVRGDLSTSRQENWSRGAATIEVVMNRLQDEMPRYDFSKLVLIGHSNGGDIAAWYANKSVGNVATVITLDHRRVPLPRRAPIQVLSVRAKDFDADPGVLPAIGERNADGICIREIPAARHNDMTDRGPSWLKQAIQQACVVFSVERSVTS